MTSNRQVHTSCRSYSLFFEDPILGKRVCERSQVKGKRHEETHRDRSTVMVKKLEGRIRRIYALFDKGSLRVRCKSRLLVRLSVIAFVSWLSASLIMTDQQQLRIPLHISRIRVDRIISSKAFYHCHRTHLRLSTDKNIGVSMLYP